jgi:multicomponent Na+:H+ antiporter subunit G
MTLALDLLTVVAVSLGLVFFLAGVVGLLRLPDPLSRLHALTKADNLGLGLVIVGLLAQADWPFGGLKLIALWVLVVVSGSVAGQLLAGTQHDLMDVRPDAAPDRDQAQS